MATPGFDDRASRRVITPAALAWYARDAGWSSVGTYRRHSDVYAGEGKPEIIVPRTDAIDDYGMVVADLVAIFARVLGRDEAAVYRDLTLADRDVMRVRAPDGEPDGLSLESSHTMLAGAREMLIAAAKSLDDDRLAYLSGVGAGAGAGGAVANYLNRIRLGPSEGDRFALVLVSPAVAAPPHPAHPARADDGDDGAAPLERRVAQRLAQSLFAARAAAERAAGGDGNAFGEVGGQGVSAELCEAVAELVTGVSGFEVCFRWAMTRPAAAPRGAVAFSYRDVPWFKEAARSLRSLEPEYDRRLHGFIERLARPQRDAGGTVTLKATVGGGSRLVAAALNQADYARAIGAHYARAMVALEGDLEQAGQRWRLRNARLAAVIETPALPGLEA